MASSSPTTGNAAAGIEQSDADLYDRQIRLFGARSQQRLFESRLLFIGYNALVAEAIKNLLLAGIRNLTIIDSEDADPDDMLVKLGSGTTSSDALHNGAIGLNRAATVRVHMAVSSLGEKLSDPDLLDGHDIVVVFVRRLSLEQLKALADACRQKKKMLLAVDGAGSFSFYMIDLGVRYTFEQQLSEYAAREKGVARQLVEIDYPPLSAVVQHLVDDTNDDDGDEPQRKRRRPNPANGHEKKKATGSERRRIVGAIMRFFAAEKRMPESLDDAEKLASICGVEKDSELVKEMTRKPAYWLAALAGGQLGEELLTICMRDSRPACNLLVVDASDRLLAGDNSAVQSALIKPRSAMTEADEEREKRRKAAEAPVLCVTIDSDSE